MAISDIFPVSPVPSDSDSYYNELPFTAFGQVRKGNLDLRVFEQDIYWVNINGEPFELTEMSQDYLRNVKIHLYADVDSFHLGFIHMKRADNALDTMRGRINDEELAMLLGVGVDSLAPAEWLALTPLIQKINSLVQG